MTRPLKFANLCLFVFLFLYFFVLWILFLPAAGEPSMLEQYGKNSHFLFSALLLLSGLPLPHAYVHDTIGASLIKQALETLNPRKSSSSCCSFSFLFFFLH